MPYDSNLRDGPSRRSGKTTVTARIEPSEITEPRGYDLVKRQHVPFRVVDACPRCHAARSVDLGSGDGHLHAAKQGTPTNVYFACRPCDVEWTVRVVARFTLELADTPDKET